MTSEGIPSFLLDDPDFDVGPAPPRLSLTCRPDIAYTHSRVGQHQAAPTEAALDALQYCFRYLKGTKDLCLSGPLHSDRDIDFAGNSEVQNKRRSQNGYVAGNGHPFSEAVQASNR